MSDACMWEYECVWLWVCVCQKKQAQLQWLEYQLSFLSC